MISIAILALNEALNIEDTVETVLAAGQAAGGVELDIIIVNDGSTDNTKALADSLAARHPMVRVVNHEVNRGIGAGIASGLAAARGERFMWLPGDNDLDAEIMTKMFLASPKADLILTYYLNREIRGRRRATLSAIYNAIHMVTFGVFVMYITGPFLTDTERLRKLTLISTRFSCVAETILKLLMSGCTYHEVAGYMNMGKKGSSAVSAGNLWEVIRMYLVLVYVLLWRDRHLYNKAAVRVR